MQEHTRSLLIIATAALTPWLAAQDRFETLPGYERFEQVQRETAALRQVGLATSITWADDGGSVSYQADDTWHRVDLDTLMIAHDVHAPESSTSEQNPNRNAPGRGRQRDAEPSPDGVWTARCVDWNVVLVHNETGATIQVTTQGTRKNRFGMASWVYGEELRQTEAMWWSPDSRMLVFYHLDERHTPDHYITSGMTDLHTRSLVEGYPKPGEPNPMVNLIAFDLETSTRTALNPARDSNQYVYNIRFAPGNRGLLVNRTNRLQNRLDVLLIDPSDGRQKIVVTEQQDAWQNNNPQMRFLADGYRIVWETEKSGWRQYELRTIDGRLVTELTRGNQPAQRIIDVDEQDGVLYYTAFSDEHPLNAHLHRVNLDGFKQTRLTSEPANHTMVNLSPDRRWFIATHETIEHAPTTVLYRANGHAAMTLAHADASVWSQWSAAMPELFSYKANDGRTDLYGVLYKPTDFDPSKEYPLVVSVYGGPGSQGVPNRFRGPNPSCEFGFLIAKFDNRGTGHRGKQFETAGYLQLGTMDIGDQADGVRYLRERGYVDPDRVGIYGSSYGGYMAAMGVLRHPDVFHVAVADAAVTDWRNYDTIYTERYMALPTTNKDGYDAGSCLTYAHQLAGKLLIQHGMVDDNVHPTNAFQLIDALQNAGKEFDVMMYPNNGHGTGGYGTRKRWLYLYDHLIAGH